MIDIWHNNNNNPIAILSLIQNKFECMPYDIHTHPKCSYTASVHAEFSTLFPYFHPHSYSLLQFILWFMKKIKSITMIKMFCWRLSQCLVQPKAKQRKMRGKGTWGREQSCFFFVLEQWLNSERWDMGCRRDSDIINSILFKYFNF